MERFAEWENKSIVSLVCYVLPFIITFLILVSGYLAAFVAAAAVYIVLQVSPDSRFRYHSIQAVMTLTAAAFMMGLSYWAMFGADRERMELSDGIGAFVSFSMVIIVWSVIIVILGSAYLYAAVKAALGKDVCLIGIGNLARWIAQDLPGSISQAAGALLSVPAQIVSGEYRLQDHKFELTGITVVIIALMFLAIKVPGFLWPLPKVPPTLGITISSVATTDHFVGFSWGTDVESTKKAADEQGWKTADHVSSMSGLGCRAVLEGYPALLQFFYTKEQGIPRYLFQGFIIMNDNDGPIEGLYQRLLETFTEKYGSAADVGYPPWRTPSTKPLGPGYGWKWETTSEAGEKVTVYLALELKQSKTSPTSNIPATLQIRYKNLTIEEKSYKGTQQ